MDDPLRMVAALVAAAADGLLNLLAGGRRRQSEPAHGGLPVVFAIMRMDCANGIDPRSGQQPDPLVAQLSRCHRCRSKITRADD